MHNDTLTLYVQLPSRLAEENYAIAGGFAGGVVLMIIYAVVICCHDRRHRRRDLPGISEPESTLTTEMRGSTFGEVVRSGGAARAVHWRPQEPTLNTTAMTSSPTTDRQYVGRENRIDTPLSPSQSPSPPRYRRGAWGVDGDGALPLESVSRVRPAQSEPAMRSPPLQRRPAVVEGHVEATAYAKSATDDDDDDVFVPPLPGSPPPARAGGLAQWNAPPTQHL